jgi:hypothetical protein
MRLLTVIMVFLLSICNGLAHEGHDHRPGHKDAPHGGIIKESKSFHYELVTRGQEVLIYIYDVDMKPLENLASLNYKTFAQIPRRDKEELAMKVMGHHLHGKFDKGSAHRYTLILNVEDSGKAVDIKWVID